MLLVVEERWGQFVGGVWFVCEVEIRVRVWWRVVRVGLVRSEPLDVTAEVKVGDGVDASVLYGCHVICFGFGFGFGFLGSCRKM